MSSIIVQVSHIKGLKTEAQCLTIVIVMLNIMLEFSSPHASYYNA